MIVRSVYLNFKLHEYDEHNRLVHYKDPDTGYELWQEFYDDGTLRYTKDTEGTEKWFDENGKLIKRVN